LKRILPVREHVIYPAAGQENILLLILTLAFDVRNFGREYLRRTAPLAKRGEFEPLVAKIC